MGTAFGMGIPGLRRIIQDSNIRINVWDMGATAGGGGSRSGITINDERMP
jgi:hypothetical protein